SKVKLADILDGTSNTMLFSEREWSTLKALNKYNDSNAKYWWNSGWWTYTTFTTLGPPNFARKHPEYFAQGSWWWFNVTASSNHPGGVNVAFTDGSVRFIKDGIACWPEDPAQGGLPLGIPPGRSYFDGNYGNAVPRLYQALSTRKGGEVISADGY